MAKLSEIILSMIEEGFHTDSPPPLDPSNFPIVESFQSLNISWDEAIDKDISMVSRYRVEDGKMVLIDTEIHDILWGCSIFHEFSQRLKLPISLRRKPYQVMSHADFCKHINMRRINTPQNRKGGKVYEHVKPYLYGESNEKNI